MALIEKSESLPFYKTKGFIIVVVIIYVVFSIVASYIVSDVVSEEDTSTEVVKTDTTESKTEAGKDVDFDTEGSNLNELLDQGYFYYNENNKKKALESFQEALNYAEIDSFEYHLITAEIALLNDNAAAALLSYEEAYTLRPADIDINSNLAYFYSGYEESTEDYVDFEKALFYNLRVYRFSGIKNGYTEIDVAVNYYYLDDLDETIRLLEDFDFEEFPYAATWIAASYYYKGDTVNTVKYIEIAEENGAEVPTWLSGEEGLL